MEYESVQLYSTEKMEESVCGSQNFCLKMSQDSTVSNTFDTNEDADIIVISDSSSKSTSSSSKCASKSRLNKYPVTRNEIYIVESSDSDCTDINDEKLFQAWKSNKKSSHMNHRQEKRDVVKRNNILYTSDESSSVSTENVGNYITNSNKTGTSYITTTTIVNSTKNISKKNVHSPRNTVNETNLIISCTTGTTNGSFKNSKSTPKPARTSPPANKVNNDFKRILSRKDTKSIIKNIKSTRLVYESPKVQKQNNSMLSEDVDVNVMHPAISPENKLTTVNTIVDETPANSESDIILDSQVNLPNPYKTHVSKFLNAPYVEKEEGVIHTELSEQKKKQISQWLMTNSPESQSDSSFSIVPPSTRQDVSSGNSSLERLEMNYETPNNRNRIRQQQSSEKGIGKSNNNDTPRAKVLCQTTINDYVQRSKNNGLELCTSAKKSHTNNNMFSAAVTNPTTNTPQQVDIQDCADILDKLYGKSWRAKADVLFPNSEPRKQMSPTKNRAIQTERKAVNKGRLYISDSDDDSNNSLNDLNLQNRTTKKNVRKNTKPRNSFINDESTSGSERESSYHTALTHPRISTNSEQLKPIIPPVARRIRAICDTDTEDGDDDKNSNNEVSNIRGRKLSFSNDESDGSSTSEFDPGDDVPPKLIVKKDHTKIPRPTSKINNQIKSTSGNGYKKCEKNESFLASLSESIPIANVHPDARKYRLDYKNNKESLCNYLYKLYNERVFDKNLPEDMSIEWNIRMRGTAGFCYNKRSLKTLGGIVRSSRIVLATKVLDTPDRLRDTLIHEMCHAAAWLINDVSDGHGPFWTGWANKAMKTFPELPPIRRCHDYKIKTKFTYKCVGCGYSIGRHSKSLDIERKRCGHCYGKFELLLNKTTKSGTVQVQTPKREPSAFALYVKENYNSVKKERNIKHAEVMKILGQQFSAVKIAKKQENNENDLNILN